MPVAIGPGTSVAARADAPSVVKLVVASPAGGGLDAFARQLAAGLGKLTGGTVVVENRPGAGGIVGADFVAKAPPDGHTLLLATGFVPLTTVLHRAPYDALRDFAPVIELPVAHNYVLVRKGLGIDHPSQLGPLAARTRGGLNCAGYVGEPQLACDQLRYLLGGSMVTVPYAGLAPATQALAGGQVDLMLAPHEQALALQAGGRAVVIANAGSSAGPPPFERLPLMQEVWPDYVYDSVLGILAPGGTPAPVLRQLQRQFQQVLEAPVMREALAARGSAAMAPGQPDRLGQRMRDKLALYRHLANLLGLKPE